MSGGNLTQVLEPEDYFEREDRSDLVYVAAAFHLFFLMAGLWLVMILILYIGGCNRSFLMSCKTFDRNTLVYMMILSCSFYIGYIIIQIVMVFNLSSARASVTCNIMCEIYMKISLSLSQLSLFVIYLYLWIRMKSYFYKYQRTSASTNSPCTRRLVWVCLVYFIFFASFVAMYTLIPTEGYKCSDNGCTYNKVIPNNTDTPPQGVQENGTDTIKPAQISKSRLEDPPQLHGAYYASLTTGAAVVLGSGLLQLFILSLTVTVLYQQRSNLQVEKSKRTKTQLLRSADSTATVNEEQYKIKLMSQKRLERAVRKLVICAVICMATDDVCLLVFSALERQKFIQGILQIPIAFSLLVNMLTLLVAYTDAKTLFFPCLKNSSE